MVSATWTVGVVSGALGPLDRLRSLWLAFLGPRLGPWLRSREHRVALLGVLFVTTACFSSLMAPYWMIAVGPVLWGVPHLVADLRYLVVRPGLHRRVGFLLVGIGTITALALGAGLVGALVAAAAVALVSRGSWARRGTAAGVALGLAWLVGQDVALAEGIFIHAHNVIAVVVWWVWRKRERGMHLAAVGLFALASVALLGGAFDACLGLKGPIASPLGANTEAGLLLTLAPGMSSSFAARALAFFAFGQAVHYAVWLRLVPEEDRGTTNLRSFKQSFLALRADLGLWLLLAVSALALVFFFWGAWDLLGARAGYHTFSFAHGYLELVALSALYASRRVAG